MRYIVKYVTIILQFGFHIVKSYIQICTVMNVYIYTKISIYRCRNFGQMRKLWHVLSMPRFHRNIDIDSTYRRGGFSHVLSIRYLLYYFLLLLIITIYDLNSFLLLIIIIICYYSY